MQYATNRIAVGAFNNAAPTLESTVVNGVTYEVFHDYYHTHRMNPDWKSVGYRIAGQPDSFNFHSRGFFKRTCKAQKALQVWMDDMMAKHGGWEQGKEPVSTPVATVVKVLESDYNAVLAERDALRIEVRKWQDTAMNLSQQLLKEVR